ncbi:GNAT family N-acetyltransferase [Psychrobacter sanguinis]|uniref:GNAT family N-acetyltransferase n=1 Tax=Psychrobacter sanguinis TaxID=861445 RepID=UPI001919EE01|nr:N-acetyltransferase [Psychrobacter sanguinis]MCC3307743.1 GNAT family N-acetyltransferase [Psychrobacter sanguinis]UEC25048.1 GNAT family N-acetyltransferase [Psychrobacter sanguinis]
MNIRRLGIKDAEDYYYLRLEALRNHPDSFGSSYEEESTQTVQNFKEFLTTSTHLFIYGAFEDNELVGMVTLVRECLLKLKHRATITAMYISPKKRSCGIGKALLNRAIENARSIKELEQIYLTVGANNIPAKNLYSAIGFEVFGYEKNALKYESIYYDEEHMILFL